MRQQQHRAAGTEHEMVSGYIRLQGVSAGFDNIIWPMHTNFRIGRAPDQDVVLNDKSVSRAHADVRLTDEGWMVFDHHSTNGTCLNGERLDDEEGRNLLQGDVLRVGRILLMVAEVVEGVPSEEVASADWRDAEERHFQANAQPGDSAARTHIRTSEDIGARKQKRGKA